MKPILKLAFVMLLLLWARHTYATTTYSYCSPTFSTCMTSCYQAFEQGMQNCPANGTPGNICYEVPVLKDYQGQQYIDGFEEVCFGVQDQSCAQMYASALTGCTYQCASSYCN